MTTKTTKTKLTARVASYIIRPSHFGGKWITESPRGISVQHDTKEEAEKYAHSKSNKIEYRAELR